MTIEQITQRLNLNGFYTAFIEQETGPAYIDLPFSNPTSSLNCKKMRKNMIFHEISNTKPLRTGLF
jgi:hypothetical protein